MHSDKPEMIISWSLKIGNVTGEDGNLGTDLFLKRCDGSFKSICGETLDSSGKENQKAKKAGCLFDVAQVWRFIKAHQLPPVEKSSNEDDCAE